MPLTLIPLTLHDHTDLLQAIYDATPGYWRMFGAESAPELMAIHNLRTAGETPGHALFGILQPTAESPTVESPTGESPTGEAPTAETAATATPAAETPITEMIGVIDIRMHYPDRNTTTIGMIMIAEGWQRMGHGSAAWALVEAWLAGTAGITKVRAGVEQFNTDALLFFQSLGFHVSGEATRVPVGDKHVRILYTEKALTPESV